jgi:lipoprotein NlpI
VIARALAIQAVTLALSVAARADPTPLLTYAAAQHFPPINDAAAVFGQKQRLSRVTFAISKDPPPEANCAQTLGAKRFATLFDDLGDAYLDLGDDTNAADAFTKALSCNPRADFLHAEHSLALLNLGRYDEARAEAERQLSPGHNNFSLDSLLVQLDFVDERWPDAIDHARQAVTEAPDDEQATYWQCFLWLAQKRAGTVEPVLATHRAADNWPRPILEALRGKITEAALVEAVKAEHDTHRRHEILSEALFYAGQQDLARDRPDEARRYFNATVNLKVPYFIEHHLAVAELAKPRK